MPDIYTLADRIAQRSYLMPGGDDGPAPVDLPTSAFEAIRRGMFNRCPRCSSAKLFARFLKPVMYCPTCAQDWTLQQTDDFPAYVSIFLTGHILAPVIIWMCQDLSLPLGALFAILVPLALILLVGLLQPAKGAIIAIQWWFGMHGFRRERPEK